MKLVSWNINGIRAAWKKGFLDFVTAEQPDILCVQETKIQLDQLTPEMKDVGGYRSYWSMAEKKGYSGVATYTRPEPLSVQTTFGAGAPGPEVRVPRVDHAPLRVERARAESRLDGQRHGPRAAGPQDDLLR